MSMLVRYKKSGGFIQLVKLLEGFGSEKRDKFLDLVEQEDAVWASALKGKLLSVQKIMSWDPQVISEIVGRMHEKNVAAMMHGLDEDSKTKILELMGHSEKRRLEGAIGEMSPSQGEITTAFMKLIEETRGMMQQGLVRIDKIDPDMVIEEDIEEKLATAANFSSTNYSVDEKPAELDFGMADHMGQKSQGGKVEAAEYDLLKRKVINLTKEITLLKKENKIMHEKLQQIKKIA